MTGSDPYSGRLRALAKIIRGRGLSAYITTDLSDIRYLTGFSGSNALVVAGTRQALFFTDFRYEEQVRHEVSPVVRVFIAREGFLAALKKVRLGNRYKKIGFPEETFTYERFRLYKKSFPGTGWIPSENPVTGLRMIKDRYEIACLARAMKITEGAFNDVLEHIGSGVTEQEIAARLDFAMARRGSAGPAFPTIVAAGARGALPHAAPSSRKLRKGDLVVMDFGATWHGYHGDFTRTVCVGKASARAIKIYNTVRDAQARALAAVKPGLGTVALDAVARDHITACGYGERFGHSLGHGVGLEIHESPGVGPRVETILQPGMVHSMEPGIYIPRFGGVRIEDLVAVTEKGCRNLTKTTRELLEL